MPVTIDENPGLPGYGGEQHLLGSKLLAERLITEAQLKEALERQKVQGGRLGENLIKLGFLTLEAFHRFLKKHPYAPKALEDTGLDLSFIAELALKHILFTGEFRLADISESLKLPVSIVDAVVEYLQRDKFVEVKGATQYLRSAYKFTLTGQGQKRAMELLELCHYVGPAPVTLEAYRQMVMSQTIKSVDLNQDTLRKGFSNLVMNEQMLKRLGPAIMSGKSMFMYGPPGTGKTSIAEAIGKALPETIYVPYAIIVGGEIISVFDSVNHTTAKLEMSEDLVDKRWVFIKRPVIMTGGELTLKTLDLEFNPISKFYLAPLQMKANNGLFIIDDFGRQPIEPKMLLNRWIVPLERQVDFMTLHTGMKFEIPFDELVIFCTNIEPKSLVDEAFLRRIRYKINIGYPTEREFEEIFTRVCENKGICFDREVFGFLQEQHYRRLGVKPNACHPRDFIDYIIDSSRYYGQPPQLTKEAITDAWNNYFVEQ
jgi:hypothetical protein